MFTDTEIGLVLRHRSDMKTFANDAQGLVDALDRDIISLRRQLAAANAENARLKEALGNRAVADLLAFRAAKKAAGRH